MNIDYVFFKCSCLFELLIITDQLCVKRIMQKHKRWSKSAHPFSVTLKLQLRGV